MTRHCSHKCTFTLQTSSWHGNITSTSHEFDSKHGRADSTTYTINGADYLQISEASEWRRRKRAETAQMVQTQTLLLPAGLLATHLFSPQTCARTHAHTHTWKSRAHKALTACLLLLRLLFHCSINNRW